MDNDVDTGSDGTRMILFYCKYNWRPLTQIVWRISPRTVRGLIKELDLQSLFGSMCTAVLIGWDTATPPPPRSWAHMRGRYWSAKMDDTSLWPPGITALQYRLHISKTLTLRINITNTRCLLRTLLGVAYVLLKTCCICYFSVLKRWEDRNHEIYVVMNV